MSPPDNIDKWPPGQEDNGDGPPPKEKNGGDTVDNNNPRPCCNDKIIYGTTKPNCAMDFSESFVVAHANGTGIHWGKGKSLSTPEEVASSGALRNGQKYLEYDEEDGKTEWVREKSFCSAVEEQLQHLGNGTTWLAIALGQVLSALLCLSAFATVHLIETYNIRIPNAQNFAFYMVLATVFTTILACRPADRNLFPILRTRGWKYAFVALADAEANYLTTKAYQYTSLTSVQLLDCFAIPTVLSLSWLVLQIRFKVPHILGVSISLLGISCLVWADIDDGKPNGSAKERFLGDMLCLAGAFLLGISNIAQEFVVKTFDNVEFLGMIGLFGSFVSGIQTVTLEYSALTEIDWSLTSVITPLSLLVTYASAQICRYMIVPTVIKYSSVTFLNLSLLSADFYALVFALYFHHVKWHALYFLSYVLVMTGVLTFSIKPTILASHVLKSLTREVTTTLDLELMASSPSTTGGFSYDTRVTRNGHPPLNCAQVEEVSLGGPGSLIITEKSNLFNGHVHQHPSSCRENDGSITSSPMLSSESCDVVLQTTTTVGRGKKAFYLKTGGTSSEIPEEDCC